MASSPVQQISPNKYTAKKGSKQVMVCLSGKDYFGREEAVSKIIRNNEGNFGSTLDGSGGSLVPIDFLTYNPTESKQTIND